MQCLFDQSCSGCCDELAVRLNFAMTSLCMSSWNECQRWVTANAEVKVASLAPAENQTIALHASPVPKILRSHFSLACFFYQSLETEVTCLTFTDDLMTEWRIPSRLWED